MKVKTAKFHCGKALENVRVWILRRCAFVSDLVLFFGVWLNIILTCSRFLVLLPLLMLTCVYNYYRTVPDRQTKHHAGCLCVALLTVLLVTQNACTTCAHLSPKKNVCTTCAHLSPIPGNTYTTCAHLSPTPGSLFHFSIASVSALLVSAVQIQMMDRLNEGFSLHTMYICTFCVWLNPAKVCSSVLVWNTYTTCIFLRRLQRSTSGGLLMVTQRKGALNIHCILARFIHIWDQHMYAPELYCLTFGAEPASGLGQSSTADQPWMAHGGNFPRTSRCPFPRNSKWAMSKDIWIGISGNFHYVCIVYWIEVN